MILIVFPTQWRGVAYSENGYPILGATVVLRDRHTRRVLAETTADTEGRWNFDRFGAAVYAGGDYTLEVISGAETITIWNSDVQVEVPESRRPKAPAVPWWRRMWSLP